MTLSPIFFAALPIFSTLIGGYVVYAWKRDLHPWLSFSGGILLGVALLELLPEAIELGQRGGVSTSTLTGLALIAIFFFHLLDKAWAFHAPHLHADGSPAERCERHAQTYRSTWIRAAMMVIHGLLDGVLIGGSFALDYRLGLFVTLAVLMHDFSDGMSTMTVLKLGFGKRHWAVPTVLGLDAVAPVFGALISSRLAVNEMVLAGVLAFFAGFFLFLSLGELLPQAHAGKGSSRFGFLLTFLGIAIVFFVTRFVTH